MIERLTIRTASNHLAPRLAQCSIDMAGVYDIQPVVDPVVKEIDIAVSGRIGIDPSPCRTDQHGQTTEYPPEGESGPFFARLNQSFSDRSAIMTKARWFAGKASGIPKINRVVVHIGI